MLFSLKMTYFHKKTNSFWLSQFFFVSLQPLFLGVKVTGVQYGTLIKNKTTFLLQ